MLDVELRFDRPARDMGQRRTEHVLRVRLRPRAGAATVPLDVAVALDTSGSMQTGEKLPRAREAVMGVVERLGPEDRLSVVGFATNLIECFENREVRTLDRREVRATLDRLRAEGITRTDRALEWLRAALAGDGRRARVGLLVTDGKPTNGMGEDLTETGPLADVAQQIAASGATVASLGYGDAAAFNSAFLVALSDRGRGQFLYAPTAGELWPALDRYLLAAKSTVTTEAQIAVRPLVRGAEIRALCVVAPTYRPLDCPVPEADGTRRLPLNNLRGDAPTDVLVRLTVPAPGFAAATGPQPAVAVSVQAAGAPAPVTAEATIRYVTGLREAQATDAEVEQAERVWRLNAYQDAIVNSPSAAATGEWLESQIDLAKKLGAEPVATAAQQQLDALRASGTLPPEAVARSLRASRELGAKS